MSNVTSMFSADSAVYHGVGNVVKGAQTSAEALKLAGLDWTADKRLIYDAEGNEIPDYFAITRSDTKCALGIVTKKYVPIQNKDAFAFTDELLGNGVTYETAGAINDGKRVWMLARFEEHNDYKLAGDECIPYLLFSNNFDGKGSARVCVTVTRVICENTLNYALSHAKRSWAIRHMGDTAFKLEEARQTLNLTGRYLANMQEQADVMTQTVISPKFIYDMANYLFPVNDKMTDLQKHRAEDMQGTLVNLYKTKDDIKKFQNNKWGAYLAITDLASHIAPARNSATAKEPRMLSLFDGGNDIVTKAQEFMSVA